MSKHRRGKNNPPTPPTRSAQERIHELERNCEDWDTAYCMIVEDNKRLRQRISVLENELLTLSAAVLDAEAPQIVTDHPLVHKAGPDCAGPYHCREYTDLDGCLRGTCLDKR